MDLMDPHVVRPKTMLRGAIGLVFGLPAILAADAVPRPLYPMAVACDPAGTLFVADPRLPGIFRRTAKGDLDVLFRGSSRARTPLRSPRALTTGPDGTLFAADSATAEVYRVEPGQIPVPLTGGALEVPSGLVATASGDLIVTDLRLGTVARIPRDGGPPVTLARVAAPRGVALSPSGEPVVLSMGPDQLVRVAPDGSVRTIVSGRPFRFPCAVLADRDRGYLVSDGYGSTVWSVSERGEVRPRLQGRPLVRPEGLAREPSGALVVADPGAGQVFRVGTGGDLQALLPDLLPDESRPGSPCRTEAAEPGICP
jgi:sugar lactone lactonase YvrE